MNVAAMNYVRTSNGAVIAVPVASRSIKNEKKSTSGKKVKPDNKKR